MSRGWRRAIAAVLLAAGAVAAVHALERPVHAATKWMVLPAVRIVEEDRLSPLESNDCHSDGARGAPEAPHKSPVGPFAPLRTTRPAPAPPPRHPPTNAVLPERPAHGPMLIVHPAPPQPASFSETSDGRIDALYAAGNKAAALALARDLCRTGDAFACGVANGAPPR